MEIIYAYQTQPFSKIIAGDIFKHEDEYYMKLAQKSEPVIVFNNNFVPNAVGMRDGELIYFPADTKVMFVPAKLQVER